MRYSYTETANIPETRLAETTRTLEGYVAKIQALEVGHYDVPEAGLAAIGDGKHAEAAASVVAAQGSIEHLILVGIGGSSMGTEAVYAALRHDRTPMLHVLDLADEQRLADTYAALEGVPVEAMTICIVSKSGTTTETLANAAVLLDALTKRYGDSLSSRVVIIGDADTPLAHAAPKGGYAYVPMPKNVGGRFSVFTTVGLVPLALLGFDVRQFGAGAERFLKTHGHEALNAAAIQATLRTEGFHTRMLFAEEERLAPLLAWYEQLLAESLGKDTTRSGGAFVGPLAPHVMTPRELHSTAQLYLSGFKGVFTTFVGRDGGSGSMVVPDSGIGGLIPLGSDRTYGRIPQAIMEGVRAAYQKRCLPFDRHVFLTIDAESMGAFMAARMLEVVYTAELFDVDAFDQPHVELYKAETRKILRGET